MVMDIETDTSPLDEEKLENRKFQLDLHISQFFQSCLITFSSVLFASFVTLVIVSLTTGLEYFQNMVVTYAIGALGSLLVLYFVGFLIIERIKKKYITSRARAIKA